MLQECFSKETGVDKKKCKEAELKFRDVTEVELTKLLSMGLKRQDAVVELLQRICTEWAHQPSKSKVEELMGSFALSREDSTRALLVRSELCTLRRAGLNRLASIEKLTQRLCKPWDSQIVDDQGASVQKKKKAEKSEHDHKASAVLRSKGKRKSRSSSSLPRKRARGASKSPTPLLD